MWKLQVDGVNQEKYDKNNKRTIAFHCIPCYGIVQYLFQTSIFIGPLVQ